MSPPPIRDLVTFRRVLDALHLFHRCYQPTGDQAAFRSRLDACVVMVAGLEDEACRTMEAADPFDVYQMFANASDGEMRRSLESFVSAFDQPTQVKDGVSN